MWLSSYLGIITLCLVGPHSLTWAQPVEANEPSGLLDRFVAKYQASRGSIDEATLKLAEGLAEQIGSGRKYLTRMRVLSDKREPASVHGLQVFIDQASRLNKASDADAAIKVLMQLDHKLSLDQLEDPNCARLLIESKLVPACSTYATALESAVFGQPDFLDSLSSAQLSQQVQAKGYSARVNEFLTGWAHYHLCKVMAREDRRQLVDNLTWRANYQQKRSGTMN